MEQKHSPFFIKTSPPPPFPPLFMFASVWKEKARPLPIVAKQQTAPCTLRPGAILSSRRILSSPHSPASGSPHSPSPTSPVYELHLHWMFDGFTPAEARTQETPATVRVYPFCFYEAFSWFLFMRGLCMAHPKKLSTKKKCTFN